jgi:hypothetical protein
MSDAIAVSGDTDKEMHLSLSVTKPISSVICLFIVLAFSDSFAVARLIS